MVVHGLISPIDTTNGIFPEGRVYVAGGCMSYFVVYSDQGYCATSPASTSSAIVDSQNPIKFGFKDRTVTQGPKGGAISAQGFDKMGITFFNATIFCGDG